METHADILATVTTMLTEVVGEELELERPITMATSFGDDLGLESIEFVTLAERVQQRYGKDVDFVGWLANKELDEIIQLRVGELVEFIASCRT